MKLLIIELDYHPEVVQGICNHLHGSAIEVGLFIRAKIYKKVELEREPETLYLFEGQSTISKFFDEHLIGEKNWDLVLFTTAQKNFKELTKLKFNAPVSVIVHNLHAYFDRTKVKIRWSPFFLWKDFSFFFRIIVLKQDWYFRKKFLNHVDHFLFPAEFMYRYAKHNYPEIASKFVSVPIQWVSTRITEYAKNKDFVGITVIGTIDRRRRDYNQIVDLIPFLESGSLKRVKITLAGKPYGSYGKKIIEKIKAMASEKIYIETFHEFIPQVDLEKIIAETDFFIAPIIEETRHHIWTEYYGKTKISGNVNNAIEYWKPTLIPEFYPIEDSLSEILFAYDGFMDLCNKTIQILLGTNYQKVEKNATKPSIQTSLEKIILKLNAMR